MWFTTWKWSEWLNSNASYSCNQIITCNVTIFSKTTIIWAFAAICTGAGCMMKDSTFNKVFCCGRNFSNEWNGGYESVIPCFQSFVTSSNFDTKGILIVILQVPISYRAVWFCNTFNSQRGLYFGLWLINHSKLPSIWKWWNFLTNLNHLHIVLINQIMPCNLIELPQFQLWY